MDGAMEIETIALMRHPVSEPEATFDQLTISMGLCESDTLSATYDDNYIPGTKTEVFNAASHTVSAPTGDQWFYVTLDTPYWYNGEDNLIIEFEWPSGSGSLYVYHWPTGGNRAVNGGYGSGSGYPEVNIPYMLLSGGLDFDQASFGSIKSIPAR
jgi:hypothetical protein